MTIIEPKLDKTDNGSPDDYAHIVRKDGITRAVVEGNLVTALCGFVFHPIRPPENFPTCPRCVELLKQLQNRSSS